MMIRRLVSSTRASGSATKMMIELPSKFPHVFSKAPLRLRSNVLLHGPPKCKGEMTMQTRSLRDDANGTGNGGMGLAVVKGNGGEDKKGGEDGFWRQYGLKYWGKFISIAWGSVFLRAWAQILRACREFANTFWVTSASLVATLMFEHMIGGISRVIDQFKGNVMGEKGNQSGKIEIKGLNNEEIQSIRIALETVATEMKKMRDRGDQNLLGRILAAPKEITAAEKTKEAVKVN